MIIHLHLHLGASQAIFHFNSTFTMFLRSILLGAAALSSTRAMLVDPVTESNIDGFEIINPMELDEFNHASFDLPCAECPFRESKDPADSTQGSQPSLVSLRCIHCMPVRC